MVTGSGSDEVQAEKSKLKPKITSMLLVFTASDLLKLIQVSIPFVVWGIRCDGLNNGVRGIVMENAPNKVGAYLLYRIYRVSYQERQTYGQLN
jgi:hypothetical protein